MIKKMKIPVEDVLSLGLVVFPRLKNTKVCLPAHWNNLGRAFRANMNMVHFKKRSRVM